MAKKHKSDRNNKKKKDGGAPRNFAPPGAAPFTGRAKPAPEDPSNTGTARSPRSQDGRQRRG